MALPITLKGISKKLINKFGNDLTLKKITQGSYNPNTGSSDDNINSITTKGIDEQYKSENVGDMLITFYSDTELDAFDKCIYRGIEREIISIQQVATKNTDIIYQIVITGDARKQV